MQPAPDVVRPHPSVSSPSRARSWAARLALLVACIGSVATSDADRAIHAQLRGTPLTLRTDEPPVTRRFRLRVSTQKPSAQPLNLDVQSNISAHWRPDSPTSSLTPHLLARLAITPGSENGSAGDQRAGFQNATDTRNDETWLSPSAFSSGHCTLETLQPECVWQGTLQLEVDPRGAAGAIPVSWSLQARLQLNGAADLPEGLVVEFTEE